MYVRIYAGLGVLYTVRGTMDTFRGELWISSVLGSQQENPGVLVRDTLAPGTFIIY